jgi:hypothetical protein
VFFNARHGWKHPARVPAVPAEISEDRRQCASDIEFYVDRRDGSSFTGMAYYGPNKNRADVQGIIDGNRLVWHEHKGNIDLDVDAVLAGSRLRIDFKGLVSGQDAKGDERLIEAGPAAAATTQSSGKDEPSSGKRPLFDP